MRKLFGRATVRANIAANYVGKGWESLMSLAFVPYYIGLLGPEAYAIIGLLALIQTWMTILDLGMTPTLTREMARFNAGEHTARSIRDLLRSIEALTFAFSLLIVLAIMLLEEVIARFWLQNQALSGDEISSALTIGTAVVAMRFFETIYRGSLYGLQRQVLSNAVTSAMATLRGGGAVLILLFVETSIVAFFVWQAVVSVFTLATLVGSVYFSLPVAKARGRVTGSALSSVWRFAGGMTLISILALLLTQADKIILSRLVPLAEFGYYMFAAKVVSVLGTLATPILSAVYPKIVACVTCGDVVGEIHAFHRWARIIVIATAPAAAAMIFFGTDAIYTWSGDRTLAESAGPLVSVIALGTFMHVQVMLPHQLQLAHGWTSLSIVTNTLALVAFIPAILIVVPEYGTFGVAWMWVALTAGYLFISAQFMFSRIVKTEHAAWFFGDLIVPTSSAVTAVWLMNQFRPEAFSDRFSWFVFLIATLCVSALAATVAGHLVTRTKLVTMLQRISR